MEDQWGEDRPPGVEGAEVDWDEVQGLIESRLEADQELMHREDRAQEKILATVTLQPGFAAELRAFGEERSAEAGGRALIEALVGAEVRVREYPYRTPNRRGRVGRCREILLDLTGQVRGWLRGRARELREELGASSRDQQAIRALLGGR